MRLLIVLALLAGWLVVELKDFIVGGGISNFLAFSLLKICIILFGMIILIILVSFYDIITDLVLRRGGISLDGPQNGLPRKLNKINHRRTNSN